MKSIQMSADMDQGDFVVCGSRPPSVSSNHRPGSSQARHHGYHTISRQSSIDESLFRSHHQTKLNEAIVDFKAPWEYPKPKQPGNTLVVKETVSKRVKSKPLHRPLLWSPGPDSSMYVRKKKVNTSSEGTQPMWNTRDRFRPLKHTPTYVDESLFGAQLEEASFEAPWNEKKKGKKQPIRPYLWDPSGCARIQGHNGVTLDLDRDSSVQMPSKMKRPASAPGSCKNQKKDSSYSTHAVPVWKP